jgi:5'-nucleotidase
MTRALRLFTFLTTLCALGGALCGQTAPSPQPYRILITNDDGVRAPGLLAIAQALGSVGQVTIVAPGNLPAFALVTTPASCVKVAVGALLEKKPDLVVSGINRGYNLGMVTYVSGTVGAAREAALMGIPAVAASVGQPQDDYGPAAGIVRQVVELVRARGLEAGSLLSVNVPPGTASAIRGFQITRQSAMSGAERFEEMKTPSGRRFFFSVWNEPTGDVEGTDVWAVEHGYAAVTPLRAGELDAKTYESWRKASGG